jgi:hypothetical protein
MNDQNPKVSGLVLHSSMSDQDLIEKTAKSILRKVKKIKVYRNWVNPMLPDRFRHCERLRELMDSFGLGLIPDVADLAAVIVGKKRVAFVDNPHRDDSFNRLVMRELLKNCKTKIHIVPWDYRPGDAYSAFVYLEPNHSHFKTYFPRIQNSVKGHFDYHFFVGKLLDYPERAIRSWI